MPEWKNIEKCALRKKVRVGFLAKNTKIHGKTVYVRQLGLMWFFVFELFFTFSSFTDVQNFFHDLPPLKSPFQKGKSALLYLSVNKPVLSLTIQFSTARCRMVISLLTFDTILLRLTENKDDREIRFSCMEERIKSRGIWIQRRVNINQEI